jgi:signal transduction histidine kinase
MLPTAITARGAKSSVVLPPAPVEAAPPVPLLNPSARRRAAHGSGPSSAGPAAVQTASVAALALENVRLSDAERRARWQLDAVRAVTAELMRTLDLRTTLDVIARRLGPLLGQGVGDVWRSDADGRLVAHPVSTRPAQEPRTARARHVAESVVKTRRGVIVNDSADAAVGTAGGGVPVAAIGQPLLYREQLLGAIVVAAESPRRRFTAEDASLLELFAAHASLAIANATLFGQIQADEQDLQRLSQRLVEVQEAERRFLARELHDEIGQALTGLRMILEASANAAPPDNRRGFEEAQELVRGLLSRVRRLSLELRPSMLDDFGLVPAVLWLIEHYELRTGVRVDFRHAGLDGRRLSQEVETAAYRVVQEALTNVARHAGVADAIVRVCWAQDVLEVQVQDHGRGFDPGQVACPATGVQGMRERAALLGGRLSIESAPGRGTCVLAELPVRATSEAGSRAADPLARMTGFLPGHTMAAEA